MKLNTKMHTITKWVIFNLTKIVDGLLKL